MVLIHLPLLTELQSDLLAFKPNVPARIWLGYGSLLVKNMYGIDIAGLNSHISIRSACSPDKTRPPRPLYRTATGPGG